MKTISRISLIPHLARTIWGATTKTAASLLRLWSSPPSNTVHLTGAGAHHTKKLIVTLKNSLHTVFGSLRATPVNHLPILSGIAPDALCQEVAVLALIRKAEHDANHLLHKTACESFQHARLKSRLSFTGNAHQLLCDTPLYTYKQTWTRYRWYEEWRGVANHSRFHKFIALPDKIPGTELPHRQWTTLNYLRSGVGRFASYMKEWVLTTRPSMNVITQSRPCTTLSRTVCCTTTCCFCCIGSTWNSMCLVLELLLMIDCCCFLCYIGST